MLGWWLGRGVACLCAFIMSTSPENHSPVQWLFSQVSNSLGESKPSQPEILYSKESNCNCQVSNKSLFEDYNNTLLSLEGSLCSTFKVIPSTARTLHNIINTTAFHKPFVIWDANSVDKIEIKESNINSCKITERDFSQQNLLKSPSGFQSNSCFNKSIVNSYQAVKPSSILGVAQDRMVTSSLSPNNIPCNVYSLSDKKKFKLNKQLSPLPTPPGNSKTKSKENTTKKVDSLSETKKDLNFKKKSESTHCENQSKVFLNNIINTKHCELPKNGKLDHCKPSSEKQKNSRFENGSNLVEVGKLLEKVLWKTPSQTQERNDLAVAEVSSEGTDTGYSSRCSTPPAPVNNPEGYKRESKSIEPEHPQLQSEGGAPDQEEPRSQSPSVCSDSSSGSYHSYNGREKYQGHQRFHSYHYQQQHPHQSQKPTSRHSYFHFGNATSETYSQRRNEDPLGGFNGRLRGQGNAGVHSTNFKKFERIPYNQGHHPRHSHHSSSQHQQQQQQHHHLHNHHNHHNHLNQDSQSGGKPLYNGRQNFNPSQRREHSWNYQQKYHNAKNRHYGTPSNYTSQNYQNGFPNIYRYYQMNSQSDLRESAFGFERRLSDRAGSFTDVGPHQNGKWVKDNRAEATTIPPELLNSSRWDSLSLKVWNLFTKHQQLDSTFNAKMELKERICHVIWNVLPMCRLFVVGSSLSGFGANTSDVDMCLMVTPRDIDQRNEAQAVLRLLQRELNNCGFVEKMELITAKVPILKFRDSHTKIDVDLNCNNSVGIRNTHLLNAYSQLDWRVRPLVLVVKLWAQHHHINNAKDMTISSYSLVLMVIHYLQDGLDTPLLPCLHKAYPDKFNSCNHVFRMPVSEQVPVFVSNNTQTLGELFLGFLRYYASKFTFIKNAISVRTGGILPTEVCRYARSKKNDSRMWKYLCIEEPFDLTNTARSVYDEVVFEKVKNVFKDSYTLLEESKDLSSIFASP